MNLLCWYLVRALLWINLPPFIIHWLKLISVLCMYLFLILGAHPGCRKWSKTMQTWTIKFTNIVKLCCFKYWIVGYHRLIRYHQIYWINSDCTRLFFLKRPTDWKLLQFGQLSILEEEICGHNSSILNFPKNYFRWFIVFCGTVTSAHTTV